MNPSNKHIFQLENAHIILNKGDDEIVLNYDESGGFYSTKFGYQCLFQNIPWVSDKWWRKNLHDQIPTLVWIVDVVNNF